MHAPLAACLAFRLLAIGLLGLAWAGCGRGDWRSVANNKTDDASPVAEPALVDAAVKPIPVEVQKFAGGDDERNALLALGSLPAWSAVLERYRLLARRDESGLAHGLLVEHEGQLRLVDESEGQGSLSIPVRLPSGVELAPPRRVVLWGAWHSSESGNFVWEATGVETLKPATRLPEFLPGLVARDKEPPEALQLPSAVSRRGGAISFSVHQRQDRIGDGWLISERPGIAPVARLLLPGEREPYGDQSLITESERWQLRGNHQYWLEIGRFRPRADGGLPVYRARTPPFRLAKPTSEISPEISP